MLRKRNLFLAIIAIGLGICGPAFAADDTPENFLHSIYDQYHGEAHDSTPGALPDAETIHRYFEPSIAALMIEDRETADKNGDTTDLDMDPFLGAQDWDISDVQITVHQDGANKAKAIVHFKNFDQNQTIRLALVRLGENWRIADITWLADDDTLRGIYEKPKRP